MISGRRQAFYLGGSYGGVILLIITLVAGYGTLNALTILWMLCLGLAEWLLFAEYRLHNMFHSKRIAKIPYLDKLIQGRHKIHHLKPNNADHNFTPPWLGLSITLANVLVRRGLGLIMAKLGFTAGWLVIWSWQGALVITAGTLIGYLLYEWLHYQAHYGHSQVWILDYLRRYHLHHHFVDESKHMGVTNPFSDMIHGTYCSTDDRIKH